MSDRTWQERFQDVIDAADRVAEYITNISEEEFRNDSKTFDAVVRNIILIGDALAGINREVRERFPEIPWRDIIGMRNFLVHEYFKIEVTVIWKVATQHVPLLAAQLQAPQSP